jgi:hypothetical protein
VQITVGRLYWSDVRDYLKAERFKGYDIDWIESSGWIERTFTITGSGAPMTMVIQKLKQFADVNYHQMNP